MAASKKIKVYLIARISEDAHLWNKKVCDSLKPPINVFLPQESNPWNKRHETFSKKVYDTDADAMKNSHMGLLLPEFGSDSAFEVGWYTNSRKPVVVFVDTQKEWLRNWMVKGGVDFVVTPNSNTYRVLKKDPILRHKKVILVKRMSDLNKVIKKIHADAYVDKKC